MTREPRGLARGARGLVLALALAGCGAPSGPPAIVRGTPCASCGMDIQDLHFAATLRADGRWKVYDDIGCLLRDARARRTAPAWLADYDTRVLHAADSMWVVEGAFPSPMGGGLAAFVDRAAAEAVAAQTRGRVLTWRERLESTP